MAAGAGHAARVASIGLLLIGGYSSCYFLALEHGVTPGLLATIMGVQPILTLVALERRGSLLRAVGLACALAGLALAVHQSIGAARISPLGMTFALGALTAMTLGALLQKAEKQSPLQVLPLQYAASLALCAMLIGAQPVRLEVNASLIVALLWLGLVFSVGAQLLFYRLIQRGNLVNVTSLFYLVPVMTAILDYLVLGNAMSGATLAGLALIIIGLGFVFRRSDRPPTA